MRFLPTSLLATAVVLTAMLAAFSLLEWDRGIEFSTQPFLAEATGADAPASGCVGGEARLTEMEARLVELHNKERSARGLAALCVRDELIASSRKHSEDMISRGYFAHESPGEENSFERMRRAGYTLDGYSSIKTGENLAWRTHSGPRPKLSDAEKVVDGWLESEGHRRNLLDPEFREVGIGTATGNYKDYEQPATMYTVNFGVRE